ncbi:hypothetical protein TSUD_368440 [Trifolium subterraneum]|uniref:Uncharacterized protein n=1 Tax=Trifolium subterraneum TaxID=3900 RepID=A0A2Z6M4L0_TRISU|nr:hypothetical protein TSUD_368440 [Trifolium subterraneum]
MDIAQPVGEIGRTCNRDVEKRHDRRIKVRTVNNGASGMEVEGTSLGFEDLRGTTSGLGNVLVVQVRIVCTIAPTLGSRDRVLRRKGARKLPCLFRSVCERKNMMVQTLRWVPAFNSGILENVNGDMNRSMRFFKDKDVTKLLHALNDIYFGHGGGRKIKCEVRELGEDTRRKEVWVVRDEEEGVQVGEVVVS